VQKIQHLASKFTGFGNNLNFTGFKRTQNFRMTEYKFIGGKKMN
jgi:hypothetical protein